MNETWVKSAIDNWKLLGIKVNCGATATAIAEAEHIIGIDFPDDFKALYTQMNGFLDWDWTPSMFSLWPLDRIIEAYGKWGTSEYVGFCDYLINCHSLGFVKNRIGVFKEYGKSEPSLIAESFSEAIHLINIDADVIY